MSPRSVAQRRRPLSDMAKDWHEFFYNHGQAKEHADARDKAKGRLKKWFETSDDPRFYADENGSVFFDLPEVLEIDGRKYDGLENRRRASSSVDLDKVDEWLDGLPESHRNKLYERLFKPVVRTDIEFQQDELYALQQEGVIPEDMLDPENEDGFITTEVTWALYPKMAL